MVCSRQYTFLTYDEGVKHATSRLCSNRSRRSQAAAANPSRATNGDGNW